MEEGSGSFWGELVDVLIVSKTDDDLKGGTTGRG